ncbi:MAG: zinc permease [Deltaproteobacteria bacterium]|nr:zinc permease [Deltaproteobacteria bacterium]
MTRNEFLLMLIPAIVALAGGVLAALWHPSHKARSLIQHFAAGVVLAAIAVELLPEIEREHAPGWVLASAFGVGSLFMYGMKLITERMEAQHGEQGGRSTGLLAAVFFDVAMDGFIIGAGFAAGGETGPVLAIGLAVELLFLGLALTTDAPGGWKIVGLSGGLGVTVLLAAVAGKLILSGVSKTVLAGTLAFSAAALLYLVTEELLIEAHKGKHKETPSSTLVLFAGFLAFWLIQLAGK